MRKSSLFLEAIITCSFKCSTSVKSSTVFSVTEFLNQELTSIFLSPIRSIPEDSRSAPCSNPLLPLPQASSDPAPFAVPQTGDIMAQSCSSRRLGEDPLKQVAHHVMLLPNKPYMEALSNIWNNAKFSMKLTAAPILGPVDLPPHLASAFLLQLLLPGMFSFLFHMPKSYTYIRFQLGCHLPETISRFLSFDPDLRYIIKSL